MDGGKRAQDGFAEALAATINHEGGWVSSRDSDGAAVYCGVNRRANPEWAGWEYLPDQPPARRRKIDLPELRECVADVYRERYWCSRICQYFSQWPTMRPQVFDLAVNHGLAGATERVQEACQRLGCDITSDGAMGPDTEEAVRQAMAAGAPRFARALVDARIAFYERLALKPGRKRYLKGWTRRAESYRPSS